jgi:endonuclease-3
MAIATTKRRALRFLNALKRLIPKATIALRYSNPWELTVAVILSAQATDKKVNEVTDRLFVKYRTLNDYARANQRVFERDIREIGFFRTKARNIIKTARIIQTKYHGIIPKTMAELTELPGIGRKTANVILGNAYGVVDGIAVDTHVIRLSRLFGLTKHSDPGKIEQDLMGLFPKKEWLGLTYRMIEYGRRYCTARCKHKTCPLKRYIAR